MEIDPWGLLSYNPSNKNFYIDSGDTLQTIAKQIGISSNAIANFNPNFVVNGDISKFKPGVFVAGAEIKVPQLKNVTAFKTAVSL
ncbi:LysM peptidoglycan-binding domain-containing protein, partial [Enterobacter hormaechei]|uniref:LysM peptidoglycan-binding domain-containing protein n=1 Tax=Enterobacter hormaechei TaxID=158836 RepID=UPI002E2ACDF9